MSFMSRILELESFDFDGHFQEVTSADVENSLRKDELREQDLFNLLSKTAQDYLEPMARKAQKLTRQHFGNIISLYAPLYISDYCSNACVYCGFNCGVQFPRTKLTIEEIEREAAAIAATGMRHILILTGEAPAQTPISYLEEAVTVMKKYFSSIALEIFPMDEEEYRVLCKAGADSLTVYQETYDREVYKEMHPRGRKADYEYRLLTPERGARAGFRALNIGALFGLGEPRKEACLAALHAHYLEQEFPDVEISLSLPRMTKAKGIIEPKNILSDIDFVQFMLAWRLFMPRLGITISTRESAEFRDRLVHLGATRFSSGSKTGVGEYSLKNHHDATVQFEVTDDRSVDEVADMIRQSGYQPVFKDWELV
ncbi:MAG: 2-iminoacetate synthase ThiH [Candidatus Electrothrix aestuarii]|uniref:2-iminoacetate synthase ThiH n=1 Tax=Candidatus Electrothrix aestuarii TaxID=3062594 RepID=A0AAU8LSN6_9BACT|nr:2-iminoacetate synthase ThiH [Candidatus Electrothrix aestuarii]